MRLFSESATTRNVLRSSGVSGERRGTGDILPESHRMATGTAGFEAGGSLPVPTARDTFAPGADGDLHASPPVGRSLRTALPHRLRGGAEPGAACRGDDARGSGAGRCRRGE